MCFVAADVYDQTNLKERLFSLFFQMSAVALGFGGGERPKVLRSGSDGKGSGRLTFRDPIHSARTFGADGVAVVKGSWNNSGASFRAGAYAAKAP